MRVRATPVTESHRVAGLTGVVHGWTTPSVTGVTVIGGAEQDYAVVVHFELHEDLWFAPELLELLNHGPGQEVRVGQKRWIRSEAGAWIEAPEEKT